eukprot:8537870-Pyramimonas_sp.AAC.1
MRRPRTHPRTRRWTRRSSRSLHASWVMSSSKAACCALKSRRQADDILPEPLNTSRKTPDLERFTHAASWLTGRHQSW